MHKFICPFSWQPAIESECLECDSKICLSFGLYVTGEFKNKEILFDKLDYYLSRQDKVTVIVDGENKMLSEYTSKYNYEHVSCISYDKKHPRIAALSMLTGFRNNAIIVDTEESLQKVTKEYSKICKKMKIPSGIRIKVVKA